MGSRKSPACKAYTKFLDPLFQLYTWLVLLFCVLGEVQMPERSISKNQEKKTVFQLRGWQPIAFMSDSLQPLTLASMSVWKKMLGGPVSLESPWNSFLFSPYSIQTLAFSMRNGPLSLWQASDKTRLNLTPRMWPLVNSSSAHRSWNMWGPWEQRFFPGCTWQACRPL